MPQSPSPPAPCCSSGETLERGRRRGRLGADPDPGGASRTGQAPGPADRPGAVPEAQLGGAGVLPRQLRPGMCGGARPGCARGSPDWCSRSCLSASLILAGGLRAARGSAAGNGRWRGGCWARRSPSPSRSAPVRGCSGGCGRPSATGPPGGRSGYFVAKVPLTVFGVWFALSVWVEALFGIASPLDRWQPAGEVRPLWPAARPRLQQRVAARVRDPRRRLRDRGRVPLRRPVDDEAGRLPRPADDAPPARPRRRGRPG